MRMALCGAVLAAAGIATLAAYVDTSDAAGGMRFNPSATLDSSQVQDRRNEPAGPDLPGWFCEPYGDPTAPSWACVPPVD